MMIIRKEMMTMLDELWNLVMSCDDGFIVQIRLQSFFDEEKFRRIIEILKQIVAEFRDTEFVPKKLILIVTELLQHTVGGNNYMNESDLIRLEDAGLEVIDVISYLYHDND